MNDTVNFQPRMLASGHRCCSQPYALCAACAAYHGLPHVTVIGGPELRTAAPKPKPTLKTAPPAPQTDYKAQPPPDGYQLALQRGTNRPTYESDDPNDGYAAAIRKQKENR